MRTWLFGTALVLVAIVPNLKFELLARPEVVPQLGALLAGAPILVFPLLILVLLRGHHEDLRRLFFLFLGLDALALLVSTVFGLDAQAAFWGRYDRGLGALAYGASIVTALSLFVGLGRSRQRLYMALTVVAASSLVVSVRGALEHGETGSRIISSIGNPNYLGNYLLIPTLLALGLSAAIFAGFSAGEERQPARRKLWGGGIFFGTVFVFGALGIHWSGTLGALAGLAAGGVVFLGLSLFAFPRASRRTRLVFSGLLLLLVMLAARSGWNQVQARLQKEEGRSAGAASVTQLTGRIGIWRAAVAALPDSMGVGVGPDNFRLAFTPHKTEELARTEAVGMWVDAHNLLLNTLIERGVLGLIAYLGMVVLFFHATFSAFRRGASAPERLRVAGLMAAYAGFFVHNLGCGDVVPTVLCHYTLLILGLRVGLGGPSDAPEERGAPLIPQRFHPLAFGAAIVVSVALALWSWDYVSRTWKADRDAQRSVQLMNAASRIEDPASRLRTFEESERRAARAAKLVPFEGRHHWQRSRVLVVLYHLTGKDVRYLDAALRASKAAWHWTKNPGAAVQVARILVTKGDLSSARRVLEDSLRYDPFFFDSRHDLACLLETQEEFGAALAHAEVLGRIANADTEPLAAEVLSRIRGRVEN